MHKPSRGTQLLHVAISFQILAAFVSPVITEITPDVQVSKSRMETTTSRRISFAYTNHSHLGHLTRSQSKIITPRLKIDPSEQLFPKKDVVVIYLWGSRGILKLEWITLGLLFCPLLHRRAASLKPYSWFCERRARQELRQFNSADKLTRQFCYLHEQESYFRAPVYQSE